MLSFADIYSSTSTMNQLRTHNSELRDYLEQEDIFINIRSLELLVNLDSIDSVLRKCLSKESMREAGSYFTGSELADAAISQFQVPIDTNSVVLDPTCGAGNLLIACSRKLETYETLSRTLEVWGRVLWGYDIHDSFIEATKLRLILEALYRGVNKDCSIDVGLDLLRNIVCRDAMSISSDELISVTHVIMNPPFSDWKSPQIDYWKKGKVNAAGVIFDKYQRVLPRWCEVVAILPDVLRSGSRYSEFRNFVSRDFSGKCSVWGRFNNKTDVDVFILYGCMTYDIKHEIKWHKELEEYLKLSEKFDVRIGPLVAYRDPKEGIVYPYFHQKNCPTWGVIESHQETRAFKGTVLKPPFVLVKRTSSPSDKYRAAATIIAIDSLSAVENHMIVISPKSGALIDCELLMNVLRSDRTNEFLNDRARMRHLTVGVVKDIPL